MYADILDLLPYKSSFRFVDHISFLNLDEVKGDYTLKKDSFFYTDHFPGNPVTPGAIIIEIMAQIGLVVLGLNQIVNGVPEPDVFIAKNAFPLFTSADVSFNKIVLPGEKVTVVSKKQYFRFNKLKFNCQVAGEPEFEWNQLGNYLSEVTFHGLKSKAIGYGVKAAIDAWTDAGNIIANDKPLWETGCVFGSAVADTDVMKNAITRVDAKESKKLGSRVVEQIMNSGITAYISGRLGLGNRVVSNSAACATGTQAVLLGYEYIKNGTAKRMLVGSSENVDSYIFGTFDSMRILSRKFNHLPKQASRPMSSTAGGFVPGSGAGALLLEDLDFALERKAKIYAEIVGGANNSGGQRGGGSMTAPNPAGIINCIKDALADANMSPGSIDLVSGHLTATIADKLEVRNWSEALNRKDGDFPMINSLKSMIGHCLSAAGSIESVAAVLQIMHNFVHPNINLEDPDPDILRIAGEENLPVTMIKREINTVAKANFGFGDVNTCLIFSKYKNNG